MNKLTSSAIAAMLALGALAPAAHAQTVIQSDSDVLLQESVKSALLSDRRLNGALFTVSALNGRVSVTGTLKDGTQSGPAFRVARDTPGVISVTTLLQSPGE
jgi:osmotically-inducible protein OsmY